MRRMARFNYRICTLVRQSCDEMSEPAMPGSSSDRKQSRLRGADRVGVTAANVAIYAAKCESHVANDECI